MLLFILKLNSKNYKVTHHLLSSTQSIAGKTPGHDLVVSDLGSYADLSVCHIVLVEIHIFDLKSV